MNGERGRSHGSGTPGTSSSSRSRLAAGVAASSVALIAFGIDSLIELAAGGVIIWLFTGGRGASHHAERRAQQMIAVSFYGLAVYVVIGSLHAFSAPTPRQAGSA